MAGTPSALLVALHKASNSPEAQVAWAAQAAAAQAAVAQEAAAQAAAAQEEAAGARERLFMQPVQAAAAAAREAAALEAAAAEAEADKAFAAHVATDEPELPDDYLCPITQELMTDPVMAMDGHTYERAAISAWLSRKTTSPMTGEALETRVVPNHLVRRQILEWKEQTGGQPSPSGQSSPSSVISNW